MVMTAIDFTVMISVLYWGSVGRKVKSSFIGLLKTILQPLGELLVQSEIPDSVAITLGISFLGLNASSDTEPCTCWPKQNLQFKFSLFLSCSLPHCSWVMICTASFISVSVLHYIASWHRHDVRKLRKQTVHEIWTSVIDSPQSIFFQSPEKKNSCQLHSVYNSSW